MSVIVADASVVVKWLLPEREGEADVHQALRLLEKVGTGRVTLYEPPHWLVEVAAVMARLSPGTARDDIRDLHAMEVAVLDTQPVYVTACELAIELDHHLFDTLYHAVALHLPDALLVTADDRYYRKAHSRGRIVRLRDLPLS